MITEPELNDTELKVLVVVLIGPSRYITKEKQLTEAEKVLRRRGFIRLRSLVILGGYYIGITIRGRQAVRMQPLKAVHILIELKDLHRAIKYIPLLSVEQLPGLLTHSLARIRQAAKQELERYDRTSTFLNHVRDTVSGT